MKVYKVKKDWGSILGNNSIGFISKYKVGDLFYQEIDERGQVFYYPFDGGYAKWERDYGKQDVDSYYFVDEYLEFAFETDKLKEYYINKKYSQYELDEYLRNNLETFNDTK